MTQENKNQKDNKEDGSETSEEVTKFDYQMIAQRFETLYPAFIRVQKQFAEITTIAKEIQRMLAPTFAILGTISRTTSSIKTLGKHQLMWFDTFDDEMIDKINNSDNVNETILEYLEGTKFKDINTNINLSLNSNLLAHNTLHKESIQAYNNRYYLLACLGFFATLYNLVSNISETSETGFANRVKKNICKNG